MTESNKPNCKASAVMSRVIAPFPLVMRAIKVGLLGPPAYNWKIRKSAVILKKRHRFNSLRLCVYPAEPIHTAFL